MMSGIFLAFFMVREKAVLSCGYPHVYGNDGSVRNTYTGSFPFLLPKKHML